MARKKPGPLIGRPPKVKGGLGPMRGFRAPDALMRRLDKMAKFYGVERSELIRTVLSVVAHEWLKSKKS